MLYQKKPTYNHLKAFECLCFPTSLGTHKTKFEPRTTPHIFLGYPFGIKGYKVLNLQTERLHVSRDVLLHEHIFPFMSLANSTFPSILHLINSHFDHVHDTATHTKDTTDPVVHDFVPTNEDSPMSGSYEQTHTTQQTTTDPPYSASHTLTSTQPLSPPVLRRSSRPHIQPTYLKEYAYKLPNLHLISSLISIYLITSYYQLCHVSSSLLNQDNKQMVRNT